MRLFRWAVGDRRAIRFFLNANWILWRFSFETIVELEPWHEEGFEPNPEKLSVWGHELVGPILGDSVRTPEEVMDPEWLASRA